MNNYIAAGTIDTALTYGILNIESECNRNIISSYKNAGTVFFNLENMCKQQGSNMILEALQSSKYKFSFPDQDLLNITFHDYMYPLPMRWNFYTHFNDQTPYFLISFYIIQDLNHGLLVSKNYGKQIQIS